MLSGRIFYVRNWRFPNICQGARGQCGIARYNAKSAIHIDCKPTYINLHKH